MLLLAQVQLLPAVVRLQLFGWWLHSLLLLVVVVVVVVAVVVVVVVLQLLLSACGFAEYFAQLIVQAAAVLGPLLLLTASWCRPRLTTNMSSSNLCNNEHAGELDFWKDV